MNDIKWRKNDKIILKIDDYTSNAEGVGRIDGYPFFVKGAIKGEEIECLILKVKKGYAYAKILNIIKKSKHRVEPKCTHYNSCGGCNLQHISYEEQINYKKQKIDNSIRKIGALDIKLNEFLEAKNCFRYRNKAIYRVGMDKYGNLISGFYANRSHNIINIDDCLLEPEINKYIIREILKFIEENKITVYDEKQIKGLIRQIMIRHAIKMNEIMIIIIVNAKNIDNKKIWAELYEKLVHTINIYNEKNGIKYRILSFGLNLNNKNTNVILGEKTMIIRGKEHIIDKMDDIKYAICANSFYQVNHDMAQKIYSLVKKLANPTSNEIIFDIYCGCGTIGLYLASTTKDVYGVEIVADSIRMAKYNNDLNNIKNAKFYVGSADDMIVKFYDENILPNLIIVDPPRKGCQRQLIDIMLKMKAERIIYVSCDVATLARDLKLLMENKIYKVDYLVGVDQFCQTSHVECIALIQRVKL